MLHISAGSEVINVGEATKQGKRTDLAEAIETLRNTKSIKKVAENHPNTFIIFHRGLEALWQQLFNEPRNREENVNVIVLWGPTGTGKTKRAYELASRLQEQQGLAYYVKPSFNTWWDGYKGEKVVIIDEYSGQWNIDYMLLALDRYPLKVEVKNGTVNLAASMIIITSNTPPAEWYINASLEKKAALQRRFAKEINVTSLEEEYELDV